MGQVQVRRAELVDADVRDWWVRTTGVNMWERGMGGLVGRLRDENWNIMYVAAYMNKLREAAPPGASWETIYGTVFNTSLGSYNSTPKFVHDFEASRFFYYSLDYR